MSFLDGKSVLVTGATGSFGKRFIRAVLEHHNPKRLIVFSRDELKQFEMQQHLRAPNLRYFLGDVRDKERLYRAFDGIEVVVHAAAMKQVPASEYNPMEAIKTNIIGAENVINVCIDQEVKHVIALSTDKAANPVNLYGATKLCADKLFIAANTLSGRHRTRFSVVRYGNVIGSRGSVIPFFMQCRKDGVLPITDERMTRFWITLGPGRALRARQPRAHARRRDFRAEDTQHEHNGRGEGRRVRNAAPKIIGIRPGEKLHEILITSDDAYHTVEFEDHYVIQPNDVWWDRQEYLHTTGGKPVAEGFQYSSDMNPVWMTRDELSALLREEAIEL